MDAVSHGLCSLPGRPDIYGVGVRAAFYTQWLGTLIMEYISEDHLSDLRFISLFSSAAATISLVIGVAYNVLSPLDIYFLLLFAMGFFLFLMPLCIWRVITRCQTHLDPFLLTNEVHGTFYYLVALTILTATVSMGTWYHTVFLPRLSRNCRDVVFMVGKVNLESKGFVIVGAVLYIGALSSIAGFIFLNTCFTPIRHQNTHRRSNRARIVRRFRKLRLLSGLIIFTFLVIAIELPIQWNHVQGVYDFATITQLLPFLFSIGIFLRSWAIYGSSINTSEEESDTSPGSDSSSSNGEMVNVPSVAIAKRITLPSKEITPITQKMSSKETSKSKDKDKSKVHKLSLKGSARLVAEFSSSAQFQYSIHSILFQRGVYPAEDFTVVKKYGLNMLVSADDQVKAYIKKIMSQLDKWMVGGKISKLVIVITDKDTGEHVERWQFDVQIFQPVKKSKSSKSAPKEQENSTTGGAAPAAPEKTEAEIQAEIAAIFRQITASVTFLPQLSGDCTFNVLVYADADSDVPVEWGDSDAKEIENGEKVQLRGFSTANHRVDTLVSYRFSD
ncbi:mitotic spindle assembly checkpoint mad2 [Fusarium longipes]|uniref:Mitotic spindle assembly checkpoint mad2 n=1 Tax=Fusarium longipes TaxID=694270 RepID=A0A395S571_9HYPO|nr:mitotic spindle assembly checkpoint mad2 [Fusarium longipes]